MRHVRTAFMVAVLALGAGSAIAGTTVPTGVSPLTLQTIDYAPVVSTIVPAGQDQASFASRSEYGGYTTRNDAIRYRGDRYDRGYRSRYSSANESPAQLHFGFFDPDGNSNGSFVAGLRGGPMVDPHIQIGGGVDWVYRSEDETVVAGDPFQQGGTTITPTRVLSRATSNLFPFQLFMQVSGDDNMSIIPYGGISGGWQVLFLSADDFTTGQSFDATYSGWGWQGWVGAGIPLSGQSRLNGEVFLNQSNPERDVDDPATGVTYRERVDADGVGMRFGIQWGF